MSFGLRVLDFSPIYHFLVMFTVLCKLIMYGVHFSSLVCIFFLALNSCLVWECWNDDCNTTHAIAIAIHPFQNVLWVGYNFVVG